MFTQRTIASLFSIQAAKTPQNIALEFADQKLSYRQLDKRSDQLAHYLVSRGVNNTSIIPICINRSFEMIIAILGVVKAGAAYVPIDPEYPAERINYILADVKAPFILSNTASCNKLDTEVILLDQGLQPMNEASIENLIDPTDLLYIIYTSGSTGLPKGVMVENRSLVSYISAQTEYFQITEDEKILQFSNYCFDASIEQIFLALLNGACLVLMQENVLKDIDLFSTFLREKNVTHLHATPGFLENLESEHFPDLKRIVSAGDLCKKQLFRKWLGKLEFYNKYGPTEATISAIEFRCPESGIDQFKVLPIGKPISGSKVYLLDEQLRSVAVGTPGEICIGGIQVARGYLHLPELTSVKFIVNPFEPGERLYKSGDLGRLLADGNIEFLGRTDDQVKIRGYRIELGEIENSLRDAPGIRQCAVVTDDGSDHGTRLVAYIVTEKGFDKEVVRSFLLSKLPEYMVPQLFVALDSIPLTSNGKVDRRSLLLPDASTLLSNEFIAPKHPTEKLISEIWKTLLFVERVGIDDNFFDLGGNSLLAQKLVTILREHKIQLPVTKLYSTPTIAGIAAFLDGRGQIPLATKKQRPAAHTEDTDVAVVGMAGRFPGADDIATFWENLKSGTDSISFFSDEELDSSIPASLKNNPDYVKARGVINNPEYFDPAFFGINYKQAELMDPQQRIFLEVAWEALESSGHIPDKSAGTIGVFAGCRFNTYYSNNVSTNKDLIENVGSFQVGTVSDKDYIASRTAYALDLKGPAVNVQSACSTSLLAIAQAVTAIRNGHCDVAIAGGSSILVPIKSGHLYEEGAILSRDGHCRAFDDDATGTVFSDAAGAVVLKNKKLAQQDGDTIFAVVKGIGLSNDGAEKSSFTAPSAEGQARAIRMAHLDATIDPADISYIEAHGTATPIGDPIEIEGLNIAFGEQDQKQYCAIGSVKSNLGHTTAASGVIGFIKACLALYHKEIPPTIHYSQPNRHIDFSNSPFYVNNRLQPWTSDKKRIAGVSSFGVGGTNVHVIVEEAIEKPVLSSKTRPVQLLCWSAKERESLDLYGDRLRAFILNNKDLGLPDISYTLNTSRKDFNIRRYCIASGPDEFLEKFQDQPWERNTCKKKNGQIPDVVFMFPGQGAQYLQMGKDLYESEDVFRIAMNEVSDIFFDETGERLLDIIYPAEVNEEAKECLLNTRYSQPALFCIGYSLSKLWMSWGIYPTAFVGHSIGEFVAAYFSGIFSLRDAVSLIAQRGKMMSDLPAGSMLSVRCSPELIKPFLSDKVALAAANGPNLCVLAGAKEIIDDLSVQLDADGILNRLLATSHAFHSHMMDPLLAPFQEIVEGIKLNEPVIPILSTVTGTWLKPEEATNPAYWSGHLRSTVQFGAAIEQLIKASYDVFLEVGPGNTTATLTRQQAGKNPVTVLTSLGKEASDHSSLRHLLSSLGELWINGIEPDWKSFYKSESRVRMTDLPAYAFNRKPYWVSPIALAQQPTISTIGAAPQHVTSYPDVKLAPVKNNTSISMRKNQLITQVKEILENASGIELAGVPSDMTFIEMGLDSLLLTQVALILKKQFAVPITFRQLNEEYGTLDLLASYLVEKLPQETAVPMPAGSANMSAVQQTFVSSSQHTNLPLNGQVVNGAAIDLISQQLQLLARQLSLLQGCQITASAPFTQAAVQQPSSMPLQSAEAVKSPVTKLDPIAQLSVEEQIEIRKPFGAAARIEKQSATLNATQLAFLADLTVRYNAKTSKSKEYTQINRSHMADPRVVSGFKPATKELVYSIVINKSKGSRLWDIDGNEYIDALNGFGSNMLGYQPEFIKKALIDQIEQGYEIGPQHELSGEVSKLISEFTDFDRVALCNTGSEAVMGAMRIARTVTGRSTIVAFTGSYHGIADEVIVRGSKKMKTFPAAPGILHDSVQNMLILDYGTEESLRIIEERSSEIAAVLVEPVQSRRADFQPIDFLKKLRKVTSASETVLIFDEVISGFRFHPGGVQAMFGIKADIGTYGKVAGGGISIGIIAGKKKYMDALDGGFWQYGDQSVPEVGVTYFAGTFVRHPLALATAKASLLYLKKAGPQLQENLNANGTYIANKINSLCIKLNVPMFIAQFGSLWRIKFIEEYPYAELFFTLMRLKGIHILEGFACFLTTAHSSADIERIISCFEESLVELKAVGLIPNYEHPGKQINAGSDFMDTMPAPNAKLGKDKAGNPAWFIVDESNPGKYLQISL